MDEKNDTEPKYSFPNSDRPLDSKEPIQGPVNPASEPKQTVKFKDVMTQREEQILHDDAKLASIETYNTDVSRALKSENISALQIALSEQRKQQQRGTTDAAIKESAGLSGLIKIFVAIIILAGLVIGGLWWAGYFTNDEGGINIFSKNPNAPVTPEVAPIKIESRQILTVDDKDANAIKNDIIKARDGDVSIATIKELVLSSQSVNTSASSTLLKIKAGELFNKLGLNAPPQLIRALDDNYILGIYGSIPRDIFTIFNVKSYDNAFTGMLEWEPYMGNDLGRVISNNASNTGGSGGAETSPSGTNGTPSIFNRDVSKDMSFTDKIMFNKDTRILYDASGNVKILYSFINPKTLIIVSGEIGFREILSRLTTGQITR